METTTASRAPRSGNQPIETESLRPCIERCRDCHEACTRTLAHYLQKGGHHAEASHIRLMIDCAEICQVSANFMLRGSPLHTQTCAACAEVCGACADDCERMGDDEAMRRCAEACRKCEESCREMAQMSH